jgi:hypothetical protein
MRSVDAQSESLKDLWDSEDDWMLEPTQTVVEDDQNPFGVSELRSTYDFVQEEPEK